MSSNMIRIIRLEKENDEKKNKNIDIMVCSAFVNVFRFRFNASAWFRPTMQRWAIRARIVSESGRSDSRKTKTLLCYWFFFLFKSAIQMVSKVTRNRSIRSQILCAAFHIHPTHSIRSVGSPRVTVWSEWNYAFLTLELNPISQPFCSYNSLDLFKRTKRVNATQYTWHEVSFCICYWSRDIF